MEVYIVDENGNHIWSVTIMQGQIVPDVGDYVEWHENGEPKELLIFKRVWNPRIYGKSSMTLHTTENHNG